MRKTNRRIRRPKVKYLKIFYAIEPHTLVRFSINGKFHAIRFMTNGNECQTNECHCEVGRKLGKKKSLEMQKKTDVGEHTHSLTCTLCKPYKNVNRKKAWSVVFVILTRLTRLFFFISSIGNDDNCTVLVCRSFFPLILLLFNGPVHISMHAGMMCPWYLPPSPFPFPFPFSSTIKMEFLLHSIFVCVNLSKCDNRSRKMAA